MTTAHKHGAALRRTFTTEELLGLMMAAAADARRPAGKSWNESIAPLLTTGGAVVATITVVFAAMGFVASQTRDIVAAETKPLAAKLESMDFRMNSLESRMDALDSRMDALEFRMNGVEAGLVRVEDKLDRVANQIAALAAAVVRPSGARDRKR